MPRPGLLVHGGDHRLFRLNAFATRNVNCGFRQHQLNQGEFDVLATLYRCGPPYAMNPQKLVAALLLTSGAMTNRLDRLEQAGLLARNPNPKTGAAPSCRSRPTACARSAPCSGLPEEPRTAARAAGRGGTPPARRPAEETADQPRPGSARRRGRLSAAARDRSDFSPAALRHDRPCFAHAAADRPDDPADVPGHRPGRRQQLLRPAAAAHHRRAVLAVQRRRWRHRH